MKQRHTRLQIALEITGIFLIVSIIAFPIIQWESIPEQIPGHYNAAGEIDRWGSRSALLSLPIVGFVLYLLLTVVSFFPSIWNVPVSVTYKNKKTLYRHMKNMIILLKVEILAVFFYLTVNSSLAQPLSVWFLPVVLVVIFGSIISSVIKVYQSAKGK